MRRIITPAALLLSLILLSFFAAANDFIVAKVNQKTITQNELDERYKFIISNSHLKINSTPEKTALLEQILDKMIDEEIILQAAKTLNISVGEAEINEAAEEIATHQGQNIKKIQQFFKSNNLSFSNYLRQIEAEILWSRVVSETLRPRVKVTEIEIRELLEQYKIETEVKRFLLA
jgi:peptidyl-prolyl cis-trans isomerase SurA